MASKLYLQSTSATLTPAFDGNWEVPDQGTRRLCSVTKASSTLTTVSITGDNDKADRDYAVCQFISPPLSAQQISGTADFVIRALETNAANNLFTSISIRSWNGSTFQTLLALTRDGTEVATGTLTNRNMASLSLSTVTVASGDRLVIEVGLSGDPAPSGSDYHNGSLRIGDASANDLVANDSGTDDYNPWVQFSQTLSWVADLTGTDVVTVTDSGTVELPLPAFVEGTGTDVVLVTDAGSVALVGGDPVSVAQADVVSVTDAASGKLSWYGPIYVRDWAAIELVGGAAPIALSAADTVIVTDARTVDAPGTVNVSQSDTVIVTDARTLDAPGTANLALADTISVIDSGAVALVNVGDVTLSVADTVLVTDTRTIDAPGTANLTVSDDVVVTDARQTAISGPLSLSVADTVVVSDGYSGERVWYSPIIVRDWGAVELIAGTNDVALERADTVLVTDVGSVDLVGGPATVSASDVVRVTDSGAVALSGLKYSWVGYGYTDGSMQQIVRTSAGVCYTVTPWMDSYEANPIELHNDLRVYKGTGTPPLTFTEQDSGNRKSPVTTCTAALDGSDNIHLAWIRWDNTTTSKYLEYCVFNTTTNTYGSVTTIQSNLNFNGCGQGDEGVAIAIDAVGKAHIVYLSTNGNGSNDDASRRTYYTNNVSGSWAAQTQVDSDVTYGSGQRAWHLGIAFDTVGRLIVSWARGNSNGWNDASVYVRTRETNGTWNSSVQVDGTSLASSIDMCVSLMVTGDNRYHITYTTAKDYDSSQWQHALYKYSDDAGASWTANHPPTDLCHNTVIGPGAPGKIRIWLHNYAYSSVDVTYWEGTGGSGSWGTLTTFADGPFHAECTVNARWSQYHWHHPSTVDVAWWDAIYDEDTGNELWWGTEKFAEDLKRGDTVLVSDFGQVSLVGPVSISVADTVVVTDARTIDAPGTVNLSRADTVVVTDARTVDAPGTVNLSRADVVVVTDTRTIDAPGTANLSVADVVLATDARAVDAPGSANISVADTVVVTDARTLDAPGTSNISRADAVVVTDAGSVEVITVAAVTLSVADAVIVTDTRTVDAPGTANLSVADTVLVTDARTVDAPGTVNVSLADVVVVTDTTSTQSITVGAVNLGLADPVAVTDYGVVSCVGTANVAVADTVLVTDSGALQPTPAPAVADTVVITDSGQVALTLVAAVALSVADTVVVTDARTVDAPGTANLMVADTVIVTESRTIDAPGTANLSQGDAVLVAEFAAVSLVTVGAVSLSVADAVVVTDFGVVSGLGTTNVSQADVVLVSDAASVDISGSAAVSLADVVVVSDSGVVVCDVGVSLADTVVVSDMGVVDCPGSAHVAGADAVTVTDSGTVALVYVGSVEATGTDTLTVTDWARIDCPGTVNLVRSDTVTVTDWARALTVYYDAVYVTGESLTRAGVTGETLTSAGVASEGLH